MLSNTLLDSVSAASIMCPSQRLEYVGWGRCRQQSLCRPLCVISTLSLRAWLHHVTAFQYSLVARLQYTSHAADDTRDGCRGVRQCQTGLKCKKVNKWYSHCVTEPEYVGLGSECGGFNGIPLPQGRSVPQKCKKGKCLKNTYAGVYECLLPGK